MLLVFEVDMPDALFDELVADSRACACSYKQWAREAVLSTLAARRLPHVEMGTHGAFTSGWRGQSGEEEVMEPEGYPVHCPQGISGAHE